MLQSTNPDGRSNADSITVTEENELFDRQIPLAKSVQLYIEQHRMSDTLKYKQTETKQTKTQVGKNSSMENYFKAGAGIRAICIYIYLFLNGSTCHCFLAIQAEINEQEQI